MERFYILSLASDGTLETRGEFRFSEEAMGARIRASSLLGVGVVALLLSSAIPARADLTEVNIFDNTIYDQASGAAPTSPSLFFFSFGGNFAAVGDFTGGSMTSPSATLTSPPAVGTSFGASSVLFTTLAGLHAQFPFGSYTITGTGGTDGPQGETFSYPFDAFTTDIPALDPSTFSGLQGLNPTNAFTIGFNSFTPDPHANQAFTFFTIFEGGTTVFTEAFLSNSTTSVFLPANKLLPGTSYSFELDFSDRIRSLDGVTGVTIDQGFDVRTDGSFTTGSAAVPEPGSLALFGTAAGVLAFLRRRSLAKRS
jgi:hypothetical protein